MPVGAATLIGPIARTSTVISEVTPLLGASRESRGSARKELRSTDGLSSLELKALAVILSSPPSTGFIAIRSDCPIKQFVIFDRGDTHAALSHNHNGRNDTDESKWPDSIWSTMWGPHTLTNSGAPSPK